jgi:hypothetical protein
MKYAIFLSILLSSTLAFAQAQDGGTPKSKEQGEVPRGKIFQDVSFTFLNVEGAKGVIVGLSLGKPSSEGGKASYFQLSVNTQLPVNGPESEDGKSEKIKLPWFKIEFTPVTMEVVKGVRVFAESSYERFADGLGTQHDYKNGGGAMFDAEKEIGEYLTLAAGAFLQAHYRDLSTTENFKMNGMNPAYGFLGSATVSVKGIDLTGAAKWKDSLTYGNRTDGLTGNMDHKVRRFSFEISKEDSKLPNIIVEFRKDDIKNGLKGYFGGKSISATAVFSFGK